MKGCGWVVIVCLMASNVASAQFRAAASQGNTQNQQKSDQGPLSRFYFAGGGGFGSGVSGSSRYVYYSIFPIIGYKVTPEVTVGTGFNYQHYGYPDFGVSLNQYGITPFIRYNINQLVQNHQLFFQTEYDYISSPTVNYQTGQLDNGRKFFNRLLFGVGYAVGVGNGRSALNAMVMYDVLYSQPSVFSSPIVVRVFFSF